MDETSHTHPLSSGAGEQVEEPLTSLLPNFSPCCWDLVRWKRRATVQGSSRGQRWTKETKEVGTETGSQRDQWEQRGRESPPTPPRSLELGVRVGGARAGVSLPGLCWSILQWVWAGWVPPQRQSLQGCHFGSSKAMATEPGVGKLAMPRARRGSLGHKHSAASQGWG